MGLFMHSQLNAHVSLKQDQRDSLLDDVLAAPDRRSAHYLINPQRNLVLPVKQNAEPIDILLAAHGFREGDWWGMLADDAQCHGTKHLWRLALFKSDCDQSAPLWIGRGVAARAGAVPALVREQVLVAALRELYSQGWQLAEYLVGPAKPRKTA